MTSDDLRELRRSSEGMLEQALEELRKVRRRYPRSVRLRRIQECVFIVAGYLDRWRQWGPPTLGGDYDEELDRAIQDYLYSNEEASK